MERFRKKPVLVEAVRWTGDMAALRAFIGYDLPAYGPPHDGALRIETLEGDLACRLGDWIIRGVKGELYPCKPDIFAETYEVASDEQPALTG
jgi:hypothetical protein